MGISISRAPISVVAAFSVCLVACADPGPLASSPPSEALPLERIEPPPTSALTTVTLKDVPHVLQKPDFCGEACVEMAGRFFGKRMEQDRVFDIAGIDPALGRGAITTELTEAVNRLGFDPGNVWHSVDPKDPGPGLEKELEAIHADLVRGVPTIVCMHYSDAPKTTEHFRLVVGYDAVTDEILYNEPAEANGAYRRMKRGLFLSLWPLKYATNQWTVVRIPLTPKTLVEPPAPRGPSPADVAQHVMALKDRMPKGFVVLLEPPFVVMGQGPRDVLADRGGATVRWARDMLKKDFFDASPNELLDVWLYPDAATYDKGIHALSGSIPDTPYGFYSPTNHGLFMNISTGGGTLVHEIVHPFVEADFPDAPSWLNEGLGSLFEQSGERDGHIIGYTNWRLAGLQKAIHKKALPSIESLAKTTSDEFYGDHEGTNYAEARYLLYYLQEKGVLIQFYHDARAHRLQDPSGYKSLVTAIGETDMRAFQTKWEAYVLGLTFP